MRTKTLSKKRNSRRKSRSSRTLQRLEDRRLMIADAIETPDFINPTQQEQPAVYGPVQLASSRVSRIVDGQETQEFDAVGQVGADGAGHCTGTLISPTHVLTAAHCAEGVGQQNGTFIVNGQSYSTTRVVIHPDYNASTLDNDIAIYELDRPVQGVTPHQILRTAPAIGNELTLVGFGAGGTGESGHNGDFGTKRVGTTNIEFVEPTIIGWNFDPGESNTAPGDSGGPAFVQINGEYVLAGVTSGGDREDAAHGDRSFDTRVDAFAGWIDSIVGQSTGGGDGGGGDGGADNGGGNNDGGGGGEDDHADQPGAEATELQLDSNGNAILDAVFEEVGDRDVFAVTVAAGAMSVELDGVEGDVDTYLRIYDADGNLIGKDDDSGQWLNGRLDLEVDAGTYYISAGTYQDSEAGQYSVQVQASVQSDGGDDDAGQFADAIDIPLNHRLRGRVDGTLSVGESQMYRVTAEVTGTMSFRTFGQDQLDTIIRVFDAEGNLLRENDDFRGRLDSRAGVRVDANDTLYVEVIAGHQTEGGYRLAVRNRQASRMSRAAATDAVLSDILRDRR